VFLVGLIGASVVVVLAVTAAKARRRGGSPAGDVDTVAR
jgi:hypothetical protein